ncbi:MAG: glycosyltransferase family 2 protein [Atopobiaceae bacterium]|jgi:glycosyltransferase EpsH|nr:glycosyltransferase family 2 protein [Atopobiaceae bacterium]
MPKASIIIPCYNAEKYLPDTLMSARNQTECDIEIICVDNNSTDATRDILERAATEDSRIQVLEEKKSGEGPARQKGFAAATGKWLYFLDADDLMEPQLLEHAIARGESDGADLVIFRTLTLNDVTGEVLPIGYSYMCEWLPEEIDVFDPHEWPKRILNSFQNWVHNKLFRASYVYERNLSFQPLHRTADLLFTCRALTEAHRIALLDEYLHKFRINNANSAMATSDRYPLDFYEALIALRDTLKEQGTWELYHDSYISWAAISVIANLEVARSLEGFATIANKMKKGGLQELDLADADISSLESPWHQQRIQDILHLPLTELVFAHYADLKIRHDGCENHASRVRMENAKLHSEIDELNRRIAELEHQVELKETAIEGFEHSTSFHVGRCITAPARGLRDMMKKKQ